MIKRILYLLVPSLIATGLLHAAQPTSRGKVFWVAFMENVSLQSNGLPVFSVYVASDVNTTGVIEIPATGYSQPFTATAGQDTEIFLPQGILYPQGSEAVTNYGIRITTQDTVRVRVQHHRLFYSEASVVLPLSELESEYMITTRKDTLSATLGLPQFTVLATEDNTTIDITPAVFTAAFRPPGIPFSITLNKGQTYQVQAYSDLTGSVVQARDGKPVAVFAGATYANVQCYATNHLYDQLYPISKWGYEYYVMPLRLSSVPGEFRIVASQNATQVYVNCSLLVVLDRGEYYDYSSSVPARISATAPVGVSVFKRGQDCSSQGDGTFLQLLPNGYTAKHVIFRAMTSAIPGNSYTAHFVNIIVKTSNASLVRLDNNTVAFSPFSGSPGYSFAHVSVPVGTHTLDSDSGFYAFTLGIANYDSYSCLLGYDQYQPPQSGLLSILHSDTLCSAEAVSFDGTHTTGASDWYWSFGDNSSGTGQSTTHLYSAPGTYTVTLVTLDAATGCPAIAQEEVQVERCFYSEDCEIFVPEGFSPNGDQTNDVACVYGACVAEMEFVIYDRWGEVVFRSTDQSQCWDGTYKGQALDNAVFAWTLNATLTSGNEITKTGNITLIR